VQVGTFDAEAGKWSGLEEQPPATLMDAQAVASQLPIGIISFNDLLYGNDDIIVLRFRSLQDYPNKVWGKIEFFDSNGAVITGLPTLRVLFRDGIQGGKEELLFRQDFYGQFPKPWFYAVFTITDASGYPIEREVAFGNRDREILGTVPPRPVFDGASTSFDFIRNILNVTVNFGFLDDSSLVMLRLPNGKTFVSRNRGPNQSIVVPMSYNALGGFEGILRFDAILVNQQGAVTYPRAIRF
jgi:hypothetical protein